MRSKVSEGGVKLSPYKGSNTQPTLGLILVTHIAVHETKKERSQFSHDIFTALNAIIGFSEVLLDGVAGSINPEQQELLRIIHESGQKLHATLKDFLSQWDHANK